MFTFNHFNFNVTDLERSLAFYHEALGLEPVAGGTMDRAASEKDGTLRELTPGESMHFGIDVELTDDPAVIARYIR